MPNAWVTAIVDAICRLAPPDTYFSSPMQVLGLMAVVLVCLISGAVGSLVVGNRMAFFSDALAHCAFTGVALGYLAGLIDPGQADTALGRLLVPLVMIAFGVILGLAIFLVRERTGLASDTVIGVFFAGAVGFGAMVFRILRRVSNFDPETFMFGSTTHVRSDEILVLLFLCVVTAGFLIVLYNPFVFASFNPSLARSRGVSQRLCNCLFILLLAMIVNLSLRIVGVLLINALLIVPAATAGLLCRNMRQLFWVTTGLCLVVGIGGHWLSCVVTIPYGRQTALTFGPAGTIVVLSVLFFALAMLGRPGRLAQLLLLIVGLQSFVLSVAAAWPWVWWTVLAIDVVLLPILAVAWWYGLWSRWWRRSPVASG